MVVDIQVINELKSLGASGSVFSRVQALFLKNVPDALAEIAEHARNQNAPALADRVHGLRSMCMTIGAINASRACERLETAARTEPVESALPLVDIVNHEAERAMATIRALG
jgi:HPt (histidine-containing phosphotransfer) domain-containing protein